MSGAGKASHAPDLLHCSMQQLCHLISQHDSKAVQWMQADLKTRMSAGTALSEAPSSASVLIFVRSLVAPPPTVS